jgi:type I restriction enzyme S subunit
VLAKEFESVEGEDRRIDWLCQLANGGIWGEPPGEGEVDVRALGPRIYTLPGTSDFVSDGSPLRSYSKSRVASRIIRPGDIVLERSGGSPEQPVGGVVIAGEGLDDCVITDFQRLLRPNPNAVEPRFLFWRLPRDWSAGLTAQFSRRTTGITNLARVITIPTVEEQRRVLDVADAFDARIRSATTELDSLRGFRSGLLSALLSRAISIPQSYDALIDADLNALEGAWA